MDGEGFKLGLGEEGCTIRSTEVKPRDQVAPSEAEAHGASVLLRGAVRLQEHVRNACISMHAV